MAAAAGRWPRQEARSAASFVVPTVRRVHGYAAGPELARVATPPIGLLSRLRCYAGACAVVWLPSWMTTLMAGTRGSVGPGWRV